MNGDAKFNVNSYISLGLLVSVVAATWIINDKLNGIVRAGDKLELRMSMMEARQSRPDPWTGTDQLRWTVEFGQLNPVLKVPEPRHYQVQ